MKNKKLLTAILLLACVGCMSVAVACGGGDDGNDNAPKFLEGALTEVTVGKQILINEFVEFDEYNDYTFTITSPSGSTRDYSSRVMWTPEELGVHTLTYTVDGQGTATYNVNVVAYPIDWDFNNSQIVLLQRGEPIVFADLFDLMLVTVDSFCDYEVSMVSVTVDGEKTEFTAEDTQFTPTSLSDHVFRFRVVTDDGQKKEATLIVQIQYISEDKQTFLEENNATVYNYKLVDDTWQMSKGSFTGKASQLNRTDLAYLAFHGDYGVGDYVMFDFTGDNMPQLCFLAGEPSPDLVDGDSGIYITNGVMSSMSTESKRLTVYGPNKVKHLALGGSNRMYTETQAPIGGAYLDENAKYRYVAGIVDAQPTVFGEDGETVITSGTVTLHLYLYDMDHARVVYDKQIVLDPQKITAEEQRGFFTEDNISGSIVAYGNFDKMRVWDKVYPVFKDQDSLYDVLKVSSFNENCERTVKTNAILQVSDYITPKTGVEYEFYYVDANGAKTPVTGATFQFTKAGDYTLYYGMNDGETLKSSLEITVKDIPDSVWTWMQDNDAQTYQADIDANGRVTLPVSTYAGIAKFVGSTNSPYVAFHGEYGVGDYVTFDFTGKYNMPQLTFFAGKISENLVDAGKGVYLSNGYMDTMSAYGKRMTAYGPYKLKGANLTGSDDTIVAEKDSLLGVENLLDNVPYRYIAGVQEVSEDYKTAVIRFLLIRLDYGEIVHDTTLTLDLEEYGLDAAYFKGSIVAHAGWGYNTKEGTTPVTSVTWDKIYPVERNVKNVYSLLTYTEFKENVNATVKTGETLNVSDYVAPATGVEYALYYTNDIGERTDIKGETFTFNDTGKYSLYYVEHNSAALVAKLDITVLDMSATAWSWIKNNGVKAYSATGFTDTQGVTLAAGSYTGNDVNAMGVADVPYVAFTKQGGFGLGSFVAVDFTGNNMPNISFFNDEVTKDTKNFIGRRGMFFSTGILPPNEKMSGLGEYLKAYYPMNATANAWQTGAFATWKADDTYKTTVEINGTPKAVSPLSYFAFKATPTTKYRLIIGITGATETTTSGGDAAWKVGVAVKLINLDTSTVMFLSEKQYTKTKASFGEGFTFDGNIILYGRPYETTTIDKMYPIFENMTLGRVEQAIAAL